MQTSTSRSSWGRLVALAAALFALSSLPASAAVGSAGMILFLK